MTLFLGRKYGTLVLQTVLMPHIWSRVASRGIFPRFTPAGLGASLALREQAFQPMPDGELLLSIKLDFYSTAKTELQEKK